MKRQELRQVSLWLKDLHPHANKAYGTRKNGGFPSDQATIRRYFAWCQRHDAVPTDKTSFCLYWGVTEGQTIGTIVCPPRFTKINAATLEKKLGPSSSYYLCDSSKEEQREKQSHGKFEDSWHVIAEWITDDKDYLKEQGEEPYAEFTYGLGEWRKSRTPGRILKKKIRITCNSSLHDRHSKRDHVSVMIAPKIIINPSTGWATRVRVATTIEPSNSSSLEDVMQEVANIFMGGRSSMPSAWSLNCKMQHEVYRSKKLREKLEHSSESRREDSRWKRHRRRAEARGEVAF